MGTSLLLLGWAGSAVLQGAGPAQWLPGQGDPREAPATERPSPQDIATPEIVLQRARRAANPAPPDAGSVAGTAGNAPVAAPVRLVVDRMAELEDRAAAGDAVAACQVAGMLAQCRGVRNVNPTRQQRQLERARENAQAASLAGNAGKYADQRVRHLERELELVDECRGVDEELLALQPYLDVRAARLGDPYASWRFVSGTGIGAANLATDPSLGAYYREHAWPLFEQMLQQGNEMVVWVWAEAVMRRSDALLWSVMPGEWDKPEVVRGLARRLHERRLGEQGEVPRPQQDPDFEVLDPVAEREAEALFQQYFAGSNLDMLSALEEPLADPASRCAELVQ